MNDIEAAAIGRAVVRMLASPGCEDLAEKHCTAVEAIAHVAELLKDHLDTLAAVRGARVELNASHRWHASRQAEYHIGYREGLEEAIILLDGVCDE